MTKFCKDCRFFEGPVGWESLCRATSRAVVIDVVYYGPVRPPLREARILRRVGQECGPDAVLFEPRPPKKFWQGWLWL